MPIWRLQRDCECYRTSYYKTLGVFGDELHASSKQNSISGRGSSSENYGGIIGACGMVRATGRSFALGASVHAEYERDHPRPGLDPGGAGVRVYACQTDSAGAFVAAQVIPGTYKVTGSSSGPEGRSHRQPCGDSRAGPLGEPQYANWRTEPGSHGRVKGRTN
jgi:hypothetical protein